jgi:hypothetical protein
MFWTFRLRWRPDRADLPVMAPPAVLTPPALAEPALAPVSRPRPRVNLRTRLSYPELAVLVLFLAASFSAFTLFAVHAAVSDRVFLGADGIWSSDQMQYLSWATDAAHDGLIADLYALGVPVGHVFLHPLWLLIGLLHVDGGLSYPLLMAAWKLIAAVALFAAIRAFAQPITGGDGRALAAVLVIALFMVSPAGPLLGHAHASNAASINDVNLSLETFAIYWMLGYFPIALAVALALVYLIELERVLDSGMRQRRAIAFASAAGLGAAWIHPWQGMVMLTITALLLLWERPSVAVMRRLLAPVIATTAPLVYYFILPKVDPGWALAGIATGGAIPVLTAPPQLVAVLPLLLPILPGYLGRSGSTRERILRIWPVAIAIVFVVSPGDKVHAIAGYSVPAALLMLHGWRQVRPRLAALGPRLPLYLAFVGILVACAAAPSTLARNLLVGSTDDGTQDRGEISRSDANALGFVASLKVPGGVLTDYQVGAWVPAVTDRPTWLGHPVWSPRWGYRFPQTLLLFGRKTTPAQRLRVVRLSGARIVLQTCASHGDFDATLIPAGFSVRQFGCAKVFWLA